MPLDFPSSPTTNQTYTFNGKTWIWTGAYWKQVSSLPIATASALGGVIVDPSSTSITIDGTGLINTDLNLIVNGIGFAISGGTTSKTLTVSNTLTLSGTDSSTLNIGTGGTLGSNAFTSTSYEPAFTTLSIAKGGTGANITATQYGIPYFSTTTTMASTAAGTSSQVLIGNASGAPSWTNISGLSVASAGKATNLVGGNNTTLLGSIPYQSNTDTTTLLSPNTTTTKRFLTQTGTGTNGAAPAWGDITSLTSFSLRDTSAAFDVTIAATSSTTLTAGRTLTLDMVNAARTLKLAGNIDITGNLTTAAALTTASSFTTSGAFPLTLTTTASTNVTLPTTGILATLAGSEALTNKSINGMTITSSTGTFTLTNLKTFAVQNTLTLSGTDGSTLNIGGGGTLGSNAYTSTAYVPTSTTIWGQALTGNVTGALTSVSDITASGGTSVTWKTGDSPASTGGLSIKTGNSTSAGSSGSITIDTGTIVSGGSVGSISIGTSSASALTIGRSTVTTTINGTLALGTALAYNYGGTGLTSYAKGDIIYASAANTVAKLAVPATNGHVLTYNSTSGLPEWAAPAGITSYGYVGGYQTTASAGTNVSLTSIGSVAGPTTSASPFSLLSGNITSTSTGSTGHVYLSSGKYDGITASGNTATSGNIYIDVGAAVNASTNVKGQILIGTQNTSTYGSPTSITVGQSGITTTINGTLALGNALAYNYGGTGLTSYAKGDILYASAANTVAKLSVPATNGWVLTYNSTSGLPEWAAATGGSLGYVGSYQTTASSSSSAITLAPASVATTPAAAISIVGGATTATTAASAGAVNITGGAATSGTSTSTGGAVNITGGASNTTAGAGGNVNINAGVGSVSNGNGIINIGRTTASDINIGQAASGTLNLYNPSLASISTIGGGGSEGGQINFARVTDGLQYWYIDSFGSTASPNLRIVENATPRFEIQSGGALSISGSIGTSGQVLTSQGAGTPPIWTTVGAGSLGYVGGYQTTASAGSNVALTSIASVTSATTSASSLSLLSGSITTTSTGSTGNVTIASGKYDGITAAGNTATSGNIYIDIGQAVNASTNVKGSINIGTQVASPYASPSGINIGSTDVPITFNSGIVLSAGTTSRAPIDLTAGTNTSIVQAGNIEYDGTIATFVPTTNIGRVPIATKSFTSGTGTSGITGSTNYALFPAAADTITLPVGTYHVEASFQATVATSTVSGTMAFNIRGAGTAVGSMTWNGTSSITAGGTANEFQVASTALGTNIVVTAASAVAGRVYVVRGSGILKVTTSGTIIPAYQWSATLTSGVVTLPADNYMIITPLSSSGTSTTTGAWA